MHTLHLISHTHWDREWFETFQQYRLKLVRLIDNLLDILDSDPEYRHFMLDGQTIVLEDYLLMRPERENDLRRYIQSGRILIGPWYILPDEFLVSPEATIRNLFEGERTTRRFGSKMNIGYLPDTFGHIGQMPQILSSFGFDKASVWRGVDDLPCEFWWQAPDGSRVLLGFQRESYSNAKSLTGEPIDAFIREAARIREKLAPHAQSPHLLLMNGDDFMEPQPGLGKAMRAAQGALDGDLLLHSTLPAYFAGLEQTLDFAQLPVVQGELRSTKLSNLLPNVLSTRIWIKQRNQTCQTLLEKWAEPFSTWAALFSRGDRSDPLLHKPAAVLHQAWRLLMQCHPHDSICGCSIDQVHEEMHARFDQVEQIGEELTRQSLQTLTNAIDTRSELEGTSAAAVVFNPTNGLRTDLVSASLAGMKMGEAFELLDERENSLPYEILAWEENVLSSMTLTPGDLPMLFGAVINGEIQGFRILEMNVRCEDEKAHLEMVVSDRGQANLTAWEEGRQAIEALQNDPQVKTFPLKISEQTLTHIIFAVQNVPGQGYRTFWVRPGNGEKKDLLSLGLLKNSLLPTHLRTGSGVSPVFAEAPAPTASSPQAPLRIENEHFTVELQPDGTLNLRDRRSGAIYQGLNRFADNGDRGDEYNTSPTEDGVLFKPKLVQVQVQRCSVWESLEIEFELTIPVRIAEDRKTRSVETITLPLKTRATLVKGVPRLEIHTEFSNQAEDHRLRAHFPAPFGVQTARHDGHFEIVQRPAGLPAQAEDCYEQPRPEVPQLAFSAIQNEEIGLLVANRGLPEVEVIHTPDGKSEIAVTLLRCVGWLSRGDFPERDGHAGPGLATPGAQMKGNWSFDYAVAPFITSEALAAYQQGYAFQAPLRATSARLHQGDLPDVGAFLQAEPAGFVISAVKSAEDDSGWVARGYNLSDQTQSVTLKTLLPFSSVEQVTLSEKAIQALEKDQDGCVQITVKGKAIVSVRFR